MDATKHRFETKKCDARIRIHQGARAVAACMRTHVRKNLSFSLASPSFSFAREKKFNFLGKQYAKKRRNKSSAADVVVVVADGGDDGILEATTKPSIIIIITSLYINIVGVWFGLWCRTTNKSEADWDRRIREKHSFVGTQST